MKKHIIPAASSVIALILFYGAWFLYDQHQEGLRFSQWISREAIRLNDKSPYLDSLSGGQLVRHVADSRVIGLGESTHGTREFEVIRLELLKLLVNRLNCRVFALEASYSRCLAINERITGSSPIDSLVWLTGFTNLQTVEMRATLQWIRDYNLLHPKERISIVGIDHQVNNHTHRRIADFYAPFDSVLSQRLLTCMKKIGDAPFASPASPLHDLAREFVTLSDRLKAKVDSSSATISISRRQEVETLQRMIHQYAMSYGMATLKESSAKRDSCMAVNLLHVLDTLPSEKTIALSAHNGHLAKWMSAFCPLGSWLAGGLNRGYFAIGFDFREGAFRANDPSLPNSPGWETIEAEKSVARHVSYYFQQAGKPNAFLRLQAPPSDPTVEKWLNSKFLIMNSAGSESRNSWFNDDTSNTILGKAFDAIILLNSSSPTTSIR